MSELLIGYARCSTDEQDLTAQKNALAALGAKPERIYVDHGLTGRNKQRPGLREALAACRAGDTLVVTKLDRLAVMSRQVVVDPADGWGSDCGVVPVMIIEVQPAGERFSPCGL